MKIKSLPFTSLGDTPSLQTIILMMITIVLSFISTRFQTAKSTSTLEDGYVMTNTKLIKMQDDRIKELEAQNAALQQRIQVMDAALTSAVNGRKKTTVDD